MAIAIETPPAPSLLRNWRFQLLWIGSGSAFLGIEIASFAYPLVILAMTGSPAIAGLFGFVELSCSVAAGIPAGALVDRWDRRRVLIAVEAARAIAVVSVFLAAATGRLTVTHLLIAAGVLGSLSPLASAARMLVVRAVVPSAQLTQALTQDQVRSAATGFAGPPLGGVLLAAGRALPFLAGALAFAVSLLTALVVRTPDRIAAETTGDEPRSGMFSGVGELWRNRTIRGALLTICIINVGGMALYLAVVVQLRDHGASVRAIGLAMAGQAVGMLLGAGLVGPLHRRFAPGALLLAACGLMTASVALMAAPLGPWWIFGWLSVAMLGVPAVSVLIDVLILRQVPDERRGRTMAAMMTVMTIGMPVGTLAGGLLLQVFGPIVTILVIALVCAAGSVLGTSDRHLRHAQWPAAADG